MIAAHTHVHVTQGGWVQGVNMLIVIEQLYLDVVFTFRWL